MMASKITLSHHFKMGKSPAQILSDTNQAICSKNPERMFITIWLGILDLYTGKLTAGNAGHQYPIIMKAGGSFELLQDKHDFVVGGIKDTKYREYELQLDPGSKLFLYTDGLTEASNASKQMFGENRILEELNREPDASPEQILENMQNAVDAFVQDTEPFDDLTMMCITYQGPGN